MKQCTKEKISLITHVENLVSKYLEYYEEETVPMTIHMLYVSNIVMLLYNTYVDLHITKSKKIDEIDVKRRANFSRNKDLIEKNVPGVRTAAKLDKSDPSWFGVPIICETQEQKEFIVDFIESNKIQTRPYFAGNIMLQPAYSHLMNPEDAKNNFPMATKTMTDTYFHGTSPVITPEQITYIGEKVDGFMSLFV